MWRPLLCVVALGCATPVRMVPIMDPTAMGAPSTETPWRVAVHGPAADRWRTLPLDRVWIECAYGTVDHARRTIVIRQLASAATVEWAGQWWLTCPLPDAIGTVRPSPPGRPCAWTDGDVAEFERSREVVRLLRCAGDEMRVLSRAMQTPAAYLGRRAA